MNKKILIIIFGMILFLSFTLAVTLSDFEDYSVPLNITYPGNSNATLNFSIFKGANVSSATMNLSGNNRLCYQENTNSSNEYDGDFCEIIYNGSYYYNSSAFSSPFNFFDGDWGTSSTLTEQNKNTTLLINYTKPLNSSGAYWFISKDITYYTSSGGGGMPPAESVLYYTEDIPQGCFNHDILQFQIIIYKGGYTLYYYTYCWNGTIWELMSHSLPSWAFNEESISWKFVPTNLTIKINNTQIFNQTGDYTTSNQTSDFSSTLNTALNNGSCDCSTCVLDGDNCIIPFIFHSDTAGILEVSDLDVTWSESTPPNLSISQPIGEKQSTEISYSVNATDNHDLQTCKYWVTRGASLEVTNTSISCDNIMTGVFYVSSQNTNYTFHFFVEDYSGNTNYSNSSFSTSLNAVIITPFPSGGGGSKIIDQTISQKIKAPVCDIRYPIFTEAWENFKQQMNFNNFLKFLNSFWNFGVCKYTSSIIPLNIEQSVETE